MSRPVFSTRRLFRRALILAHRFVFGSLLLGLLITLGVLYGGLALVKYKLSRGIHIGDMAIQAQGTRVGWDLCLRMDSLLIQSPSLRVDGELVRLRPVIAKNFWAVYPALRLSMGPVKVHTFAKTDTDEVAKAKVPTFPALRWPMPWSIDVSDLSVFARGKSQITLQDVQVSTRGMLGVKAKATVKAGEWGHLLPPSLAAGLKCEVSARWRGPDLTYHAQVRTVQGDSVEVRGRRLRDDLRLAKDSLTVKCARPSFYAPESLALALLPYRDVALSLSLDTRKRVSYDLKASFRADTLLMVGGGDLSVAVRGGLSRAWFEAELHTFAGGKAAVTGELPFEKREKSDSTVTALAKLRPAKANFSANIQNLNLAVGGRILPADGQIREGVFAPGLVTAQFLTAAGSDIRLAFHLRKAWNLAFEGDINPGEPWAHGWTDTNITFAALRVQGQVKPGPVLVQVKATARKVRAYRAEADSLHAYSSITNSSFNLDSARIYYDDHLWNGGGHVIWKKRGRFLLEGVDLQFTAENAEWGRGVFRMPRRGQLEARAENLAAHITPYVPLQFLARFAPRVTGDFHWNLLNQQGAVQAHVLGGEKIQNAEAILVAEWTAQELRLDTLLMDAEGMQAWVSGQVKMGGKPFYEVYKARLHDILGLRLGANHLDLAVWAARFLPSAGLLGGVLQGELSYSPDQGLGGGLVVEKMRWQAQPEALEFGDLSLLGRGDTLALKLTTHSKTEPFFNSRLHVRALRPLTLQPDLIIDATLRDSMHIAARAHLENGKVLRGAFDLVGSVELPSGIGSLRQVHWLTAFDWQVEAGVAGLRAESRAFRGLFAAVGWPQQSFEGRLQASDGKIKLEALQLRDPDGKTLTAQAHYAIGPAPQLQFKVRGDHLALSYGGQRLGQLHRLEVDGLMQKGAFEVVAKAGQAEYGYRKGSILAQGKVENLAVDFRQTLESAQAGQTPEPGTLQIRGTLSQSLFQHKIGGRELTGMLYKLLRLGKAKNAAQAGAPGPKANGQGGSGGGTRARPLEIALQIDTKGQDNRVETEIGRLNFAGDISARGIFPYLLLNGTVTSLKGGEIGQKSQAYELRDLELKWQNAPPQEGTIALEGDKKLKIDCDPKTQKTCHVTIRFDGRFDEAKFSYETDCGGEEGEAIKPTAIINSVARGCYTGDLTGGDGEGDYSKTLVNLLTPIMNENLTRAIHKGSAGWIKSANVTGLTQLVEGENAQIETDEPVALNLESKEKYRIRLLGRGGYFPASKQSSTYDLKVVAEWRPPIDRWVSDSTWKARLKDKVTVDIGIESRPEERIADVERQVRRQVGLKYKHQFWKFWW